MTMRAVAVLVLVAMYACGAAAAFTNDFPVIGIMDQPLRGPSGASYIASSYVKYLESSGARVVPLSYRASPATLLSLVSRLNGVLFTGGGTDLLPGAQYYESAKVIYDYALQANDRGDYFPLWGTCMGFQLLTILTANDASVLASNAFDSYNLPIPLIPNSLSRTSRLLGPSTLSDSLYIATMTQNITMNNHHDGVYPEVFAANAQLSRFFNVLSTNVDRKGKAFVSTIEAKRYPIYGVQWHPEKAPFEWTPTEQPPHSAVGILLTQAMSNFFVAEARKSAHAFAPADLQAVIIYNFNPIFTGAQGSDFMQEYQWA